MHNWYDDRNRFQRAAFRVQMMACGLITVGCADDGASGDRAGSTSSSAAVATAPADVHAAVSKLDPRRTLNPDGEIDGVDLTGVRIGDVDIDLLARLPYLKLLNFNSSSLSDAHIPRLGKLQELTSLNMSNTGITDAGLSRLRELPRIRSINLFNCPHVTDAGVAHLARFAELQELVLSGTKIGIDGLNSLQGFSNLRVLHLNSTNITDSALIGLESFSQLESLSLGQTGISDSGLNELRALTSLKELRLDLCSEISDEGLDCLKSLTALESLRLSGTPISDAGLKSLYGMKTLKRLDVSGTLVSVAGMLEFLQNEQLEFVTMPYGIFNSGYLGLHSPLVTDSDLAALKFVSRVERFSLTRCRITDAGLKHVAQLSGLKSLDLQFTEVSEEGLADLRKKLPDCAIAY